MEEPEVRNEEETPQKESPAAAKKKRGRDKIFDNNYDSAEVNTMPISFSREDLSTEDRIDEQVDRSMVRDDIQKIVEGCDWAEEMLGREQPLKTVSKKEMNSLFKFIFDRIGERGSVEVFDYMCSAMDIESNKFYDMLSNSVKSELIVELRRRGFLQGNIGILP